ncbi:hypothetical protein [Pedobacter frigoris]|uniref:Prepilin-type N-terminal cleavage/methylation domain-containing protein n=1 Tax=Pedobacter frigoris TaxID=2571272 RepID=A0A4U1CQI2_9SPHI|nr:hypothetical protein [Pedobacter frigoris]TKC09085.1 hypothetical protein FA047_03035 [Pedobacter frigoris]
MKLNKKLPAFTIMEVTISMLVAGIAIAIAFTAFRIVSGSYSGFTKKQEKVAALTTLDKVLKQDFLKADSIVRTEDGLVLKVKEGLITYQFDDQYLVRDQLSLRQDTFKMPVHELVLSFEKRVSEAGDRVDQLSFKTEADGDLIPLQYQKIYSAKDLFQ